MSVHDRVPFARQDTSHVNQTGSTDGKSHGRLSPILKSPGSLAPNPRIGLRRTPSNLSIITDDEGAPDPVQEPPNDGKSRPVSWLELPRKDQLLILAFVRFAEPITQTSLSAYMFYMLRFYDPSKTDAEIASQAGLLTAAFTGAQCLTAVMYGRLADGILGRKPVLLIGLSGTCLATLGIGFSTSFRMAFFWRCVGGALNGNVGVMRTMIGEIVKEKKYQPKAFLLMPATFNVGVLIGPLLGGWLQSPYTRYPSTFGPGSRLGGVDGVQWMAKYPYALPNIVMAVFLFSSFLLAFFGLQESHIDKQHRRDYGREIGLWLVRRILGCFRRGKASDYARIEQHDEDDVELRETPYDDSNRDEEVAAVMKPPMKRPKLPFKRIFTRNVCLVFLTHGLLALHLGAFQNLWFVFLSTPRFDPEKPEPSWHKTQTLPFGFTGGLGLPPPTIGFAVGIIGVIGLTLQFGVYSRLTHQIGLLPCYRYAALLFPAVYLLVPLLVLVPTRAKPPEASDGPWMWMAISTLLFFQTLGRTFSLPISQILCNNCTPHPSVLGTVHGIAQTVSSASRTVGPILLTWLYGLGLRKGIVGIAWWSLACQAILVVISALFIYEGNGHEIVLEGDDVDDESAR